MKQRERQLQHKVYCLRSRLSSLTREWQCLQEQHALLAAWGDVLEAQRQHAQEQLLLQADEEGDEHQPDEAARQRLLHLQQQEQELLQQLRAQCSSHVRPPEDQQQGAAGHGGAAAAAQAGAQEPTSGQAIVQLLPAAAAREGGRGAGAEVSPAGLAAAAARGACLREREEAQHAAPAVAATAAAPPPYGCTPAFMKQALGTAAQAQRPEAAGAWHSCLASIAAAVLGGRHEALQHLISQDLGGAAAATAAAAAAAADGGGQPGAEQQQQFGGGGGGAVSPGEAAAAPHAAPQPAAPLLLALQLSEGQLCTLALGAQLLQRQLAAVALQQWPAALRAALCTGAACSCGASGTTSASSKEDGCQERTAGGCGCGRCRRRRRSAAGDAQQARASAAHVQGSAAAGARLDSACHGTRGPHDSPSSQTSLGQGSDGGASECSAARNNRSSDDGSNSGAAAGCGCGSYAPPATLHGALLRQEACQRSLLQAGVVVRKEAALHALALAWLASILSPAQLSTAMQAARPRPLHLTPLLAEALQAQQQASEQQRRRRGGTSSSGRACDGGDGGRAAAAASPA